MDDSFDQKTVDHAEASFSALIDSFRKQDLDSCEVLLGAIRAINKRVFQLPEVKNFRFTMHMILIRELATPPKKEE